MGLFRKKDKMNLKDIMLFNNKSLSYVLLRDNSGERTLGKNGGISIKEDALVIVCDGTEVSRISLDEIKIFTLMSGNGCDIKGKDFKTNENVHLIAYYSKII